MTNAAAHIAKNASLDEFHERLLAESPRPARLPGSAPQVRRRGSLEQGRALEALGHAVEYLMDSGMFVPGRGENDNNQAAIKILMRLSRAVFEECPEVLPLRRRLGHWGHRMLARALRQTQEPARPAC